MVEEQCIYLFICVLICTFASRKLRRDRRPATKGSFLRFLVLIFTLFFILDGHIPWPVEFPQSFPDALTWIHLGSEADPTDNLKTIT